MTVTPLCECCTTGRPATFLRRIQVRAGSTWLPEAGYVIRRHPLCAPCAGWLRGVVEDALQANPSALHGAPLPTESGAAVNERCHLCRQALGTRAAIVESAAIDRGAPEFPRLLLCASCEQWLASLAADGRSARQLASREIDGPYGSWPHPNLRGLHVQADVGSPGLRFVIQDTCAAMEVLVAWAVDADDDGVILLEAGHGRAVERLRLYGSTSPGTRRCVVLAPLDAQSDVLGAFELGATDWLTLPVTAQQLTAALTRATRQFVRPPLWDAETALPVAVEAPSGRPLLEIRPRPGVEPFEAAWLVRRFARGYDELFIHRGHLVLSLRTSQEHVEQVAARMRSALDGTCDVVRYAPASVPRFEAAG